MIIGYHVAIIIYNLQTPEKFGYGLKWSQYTIKDLSPLHFYYPFSAIKSEGLEHYGDCVTIGLVSLMITQ